jgi:hypothetical protein
MKKRKNPREIINQSLQSRKCWFEVLPKDDQRYIYTVAKAMADQPSAKPYAVAPLLIAELGLKSHPNTVALILKKMIASQSFKGGKCASQP